MIQDFGYRGVSYSPTSMLTRVMALAHGEWRAMIGRPRGVVLYLLCMYPSVFGLFILTIRNGMLAVDDIGERELRALPGASNPASAEFYLQPLQPWAYMPLIVLTALVGARSISKDRGANALELLWTRSLSPGAYFLGKWLGSVFVLGIPIVACPLALWLIAVFTAQDWGVLVATRSFMPALLLGLIGFTLLLAFLAVAFSALAASANVSTIMWILLLAGTSGTGHVLAQIFREYSWRALNPVDAGGRLVHWAAGVRPVRDYEPGVAALALAVLVVPLTLLLVRRLHLREAVT